MTHDFAEPAAHHPSRARGPRIVALEAFLSTGPAVKSLRSSLFDSAPDADSYREESLLTPFPSVDLGRLLDGDLHLTTRSQEEGQAGQLDDESLLELGCTLHTYFWRSGRTWSRETNAFRRRQARHHKRFFEALPDKA